MPSAWIIAHHTSAERAAYTLYMIDWKRNVRYSWEGWSSLADLLQAHIPVRTKTGGTHISMQPCAKIAKQALLLHVDERQSEQLEQLFYRSLSKRRWSALLQQVDAQCY
ncbi:hypothetical protein [Paenibacillus campi]|uniref:hypothetical protein n=1 Tax=Paenibacillus campi TaxID=3106031 RepID=UPI002AFFC745|nr:hypothetical protein [Paenibacillus sp. SGZ-1009]